MLTRPLFHIDSRPKHYDYGGLFASNEPLSVVAANPTATTLAGTTIVSVTFSGTSTTGTQVGTITETFVLGPSTAAYTEELPGLSMTDACILTRSLSQGSCFFASTALNTDSISTWTTAFETYTLAPAGFSLQLSYIVTAGQEKLSMVTTTATSSTLSTNAAPSTSCAPPISSAPSASFPTSTVPPLTYCTASNGSVVSATNAATAALTPTPAIPIGNRAPIRHDTRYLGSAVVGLAAAVVVALLPCF